MKKRFIVKISAFCLSLLLIFQGVSCANPDNACAHLNTTTNVVKEANCTENGEKVIICDDCNKQVSRSVINKLNHNYAIVKEQSVQATCGNQGLEVKKCRRCNDIVQTILDRTSHSMVNCAKLDYLDTTTSTEAIFYKSCEFCGYYDQQTFSVPRKDTGYYEPTTPTLTLYDTQESLSYGLSYNTKAAPICPSVLIKETGKTEWTYCDVQVTQSVLGGDNYSNRAILEVESGKSYQYKIIEEIFEVESEIFKFTAVNPNASEFKFASFGDSQQPRTVPQDSGEQWGKILSKVSNSVDFYVHAGDIVDQPQYNDNILAMLDTNRQYFATKPMMVVTGNHGTYRSNFTFEHFYVNIPEQGATTSGIYYSFTYGNAKFIMLNNASLTSDYKISSAQYTWLVHELSNNTATWTIVVMHRPIYAAGTYATDDKTFALRSQLSDVFARYGVDLVLSGHEHVAMKTYPIGERSAINKCTQQTVSGIKYDVNPQGTIYFSCGTTGEKLYGTTTGYENEKDFFEIRQEDVERSFIEYTVTQDTITIAVKYLVGSNIVTFKSWGIIKSQTV